MQIEASTLATEAAVWRSPASFAEHFSRGQWRRARHLDVIDYEFQNLLNDPELDMLIVKMPIRHGKSEYLARWAPAHYILTRPHNRVIICSNTLKLARSHSRWVRDKVHELAPMAGLYGVDSNNASSTEWQLSGQGMGGCIASGVTGSIVGFGADLLILDDYLKDAKSAFSQSVRDAQWEWLVSTSSTRLEPGGKLVILCSAWHSDDLIGRCLSKRDEMDLRLRCITLQALRDESEGKDPLGRKDGEALWPERWPAEVMERRKKRAGMWWWSIYQGRPRGSGLNAWPPEYFYNLWANDDEWPKDRMLMSAIALDPSKGKNSKIGDYQAMIYVGYSGGTFWVEADIDRRPVPQMIKRLVQFNQEMRPGVTAIEANVFQELLGEDYMEECERQGYNVDPPLLLTNTVNKDLRIERLGKFLQGGMFKFRKTAGCELLINQLKGFPNDKYRDGPDALEQAVRALCEHFAALSGFYDTLESSV